MVVVYEGDETLGTRSPFHKYAIVNSKPTNVKSFDGTHFHILPKE